MISRSLKDKSIKMRERLHDWMDLNRMGQEGDMFHATDPRVRELLQRTAGVLKPGAGQEEAMAFAEALRVVERAISTPPAAGVPEVEELKRLVALVPPPPWHVDKFNRGSETFPEVLGGAPAFKPAYLEPVHLLVTQNELGWPLADFIAAAVNAVPALLAAPPAAGVPEEARAALEAVRELVSLFDDSEDDSHEPWKDIGLHPALRINLGQYRALAKILASTPPASEQNGDVK